MAEPSDPSREFRKLDDLFRSDVMKDAERLRKTEESRAAQQTLSLFRRDYKDVIEAVVDVVDFINDARGEMDQHLDTSRRLVDPDYGKPFSGLADSDDCEDQGWCQGRRGRASNFRGFADFEGYGTLETIKRIGTALHKYFGHAYRELFTIADLYGKVMGPALSDGIETHGDLQRVFDSMNRITSLTVEQIDGLHEFEMIAGKVYITCQSHNKTMKRKYQGMGEKEKEDPQQALWRRLFGDDDDEKSRVTLTGANLQLVDENCVLTDTLMDIANNLPKRYETSVPTRKDGRTKVIKRVDEQDIQNAADVLMRIAHPLHIRYIKEPNSFPAAVASSLEIFYSIYKELEPRLRRVIESAQSMEYLMIQQSEKFEKRIADPAPVTKRLRRLNYESIKPDREESQPRSRVEKDYGRARMALLVYLKDALHTLEGLPMDSEEREKAAIEAVRKSIGLKEDMDEIVITERDRRLRRDIREENEFYVGRTGHIGEFHTEREPAPKIRYRDVFGRSFEEAKEHVEEVINIAAFPQILKASAPRGKIKSNLLLIGPYGCGKTEFARAVAGDRRVIGLYVGVADVLTAYMHESVKNVKRVWEQAKELRKGSRYTKPVAVIQDEFDAWFLHGDFGFRHADEQQIQRTLQEIMDGVVEYDGIFTLALTNRPGVIPDAILRRFKYVDVVGQLTQEERAQLFKRFLVSGMPISPSVRSSDYQRWAEMMVDAPGDVLGKVADEIHFKLMREYTETHPKSARQMERYLVRTVNERDLSRTEYSRVKRELANHRRVSRGEIDEAVDYMLKQPPVQKMINSAREVYRDADKIMQGLSNVGDYDDGIGFGAKEKSKIWTSSG